MILIKLLALIMMTINKIINTVLKYKQLLQIFIKQPVDNNSDCEPSLYANVKISYSFKE